MAERTLNMKRNNIMPRTLLSTWILACLLIPSMASPQEGDGVHRVPDEPHASDEFRQMLASRDWGAASDHLTTTAKRALEIKAGGQIRAVIDTTKVAITAVALSSEASDKTAALLESALASCSLMLDLAGTSRSVESLTCSINGSLAICERIAGSAHIRSYEQAHYIRLRDLVAAASVNVVAACRRERVEPFEPRPVVRDNTFGGSGGLTPGSRANHEFNSIQQLVRDAEDRVASHLALKVAKLYIAQYPDDGACKQKLMELGLTETMANETISKLAPKTDK